MPPERPFPKKGGSSWKVEGRTENSLSRLRRQLPRRGRLLAAQKQFCLSHRRDRWYPPPAVACRTDGGNPHCSTFREHPKSRFFQHFTRSFAALRMTCDGNVWVHHGKLRIDHSAIWRRIVQILHFIQDDNKLNQCHPERSEGSVRHVSVPHPSTQRTFHNTPKRKHTLSGLESVARKEWSSAEKI